jgi:hypothetical protein
VYAINGDGYYLFVGVDIGARALTIKAYYDLDKARKQMKEFHASNETLYNTVVMEKQEYAVTYDSTLNPVFISRIVALRSLLSTYIRK